MDTSDWETHPLVPSLARLPDFEKQQSGLGWAAGGGLEKFKELCRNVG